MERFVDKKKNINMEQEKLSFQTILSECINNPEGEIANTELNADSKEFLDKANEALDIIKKNWDSLKAARKDGRSTLEWAEEKVEEIKEQEKEN